VNLNIIRDQLGSFAVQNLLNADGNSFTAVANRPNVYSNGKFCSFQNKELLWCPPMPAHCTMQCWLTRLPSQGNGVDQCGHFVNRGSLNVDICSFLCKNLRIFRNLWYVCIRQGGSWASVDILRTTRSIFGDIVRTSFMDGPLLTRDTSTEKLVSTVPRRKKLSSCLMKWISLTFQIGRS